MIGVIADAADHEVVREFFELFKTPWEFYRQDRSYDVLLCAGDRRLEATPKLVIVYSGKKSQFDAEQQGRTSKEHQTTRLLSFKNDRFPIYGNTITFANMTGVLLKDEASQECAGYLEKTGENILARVGYDLFREIRTLLTDGQPPANASVPAVELHITFLRELIAGSGIPLVEIPPVPHGFNFIACLTHDVDHPSIRQHKWDHTMLGFVYRATLGSLRKLLSGQIPLRHLLTNWLAVLKLPFVYLGVAKDFWREFAEQYQLVEQGIRSTFFIIPYKNRPGVGANGAAPSFRASGYGARDIADIIRRLVSDGHEVGLHGIDAWADSSKGSEEFKEIQLLTGTAVTGVRMHWLYYDQNTPQALEKAGAIYDSTFGYNENVGYRAGTTQIYKPLQTAQLLELPLHVMDTALLYPSRLDLSPKQAAPVLAQMQDNVVRFGGVLTINWHDRSLAPERCWDAPYRRLLESMKGRCAWFATAGEAVSWFRKRRSTSFEIETAGQQAVRVKLPAGQPDNLPPLKLRKYQPSVPAVEGSLSPVHYIDVAVGENREATVSSGMKA
jgi:peptidoglycan/xylan/chitin deacetylase (PgdA/CDA1 family)